jgi:hypothetical protein
MGSKVHSYDIVKTISNSGIGVANQNPHNMHQRLAAFDFAFSNFAFSI